MLERQATSGVLAAALLLAAAACSGGGERGRAADTTSMAAPATAPMAAPAGSAMTKAAAPAAALTDANIVYILDEANAADSARGQLARTKGTAADVRSYGELMVGEHHALRVAGQELARKLGVNPLAPSGDRSEADAKAEMDSLKTMAKGAAWDRAYIDYEVNYHKAVIETAKKALDETQTAELKDLIRSATPTLQHHLDRALQIQKSLAG